MKKILVLFLGLMAAALGAEPLLIVTTTTDLAHFARRVGGPRVKAESLVRATEDPHRIEARPDFILKASKADGFVEMGLDLESGWSPVLLSQSRNSRIQKGAQGYCDASQGVRIIEKPQKQTDRSMGDVHVFGNPHYQTDPLNAMIAARNIRDLLMRIDPGSQALYRKNFEDLSASLKRLTLEEAKLFAPFKGLKVAVYHREFAYYSQRFGLTEVASVEEKPGVPPSAAYIQTLTAKLKEANVRILLRTAWNDARTTDSVAERIGARALAMPISVGSGEGTETYEDLIRAMGKKIRDAAK